MTNNQLKSYADRIARLTEEKRGITEDIKDIEAEAKSNGYDLKVLREAIKFSMLTAEKQQEKLDQMELFDTYWSAIK